MRPAVMCMLWAGLRPQEVKALDIDRDVDFEHDTITVRQTAHVNGTKYAITGQGKTDWANRTIPLLEPLKTAMKGLHGPVITSANEEQVTIQAWRTAWASYIFCMETAINGVQKRWYGKKKGTGDRPWIDFDIVPYTLRHAYCAFLRDSGVELNTARRWMGHADAKMILRVYDSVSDDRESAEREKVTIRVQSGVQGQTEQPPDRDE